MLVAEEREERHDEDEEDDWSHPPNLVRPREAKKFFEQSHCVCGERLSADRPARSRPYDSLHKAELDPR